MKEQFKQKDTREYNSVMAVSDCIERFPTYPEGDTRPLVDYLKRFSLTDKRILLKDIAMSNHIYSGKIIQFIDHFGLDPKNIDDRKVLIDVAKLIASKKHLSGTTSRSEYVKNYGFDPNDESDRVILLELAEISAESDPYDTSSHLSCYALDPTNPAHKTDLAMVAMAAARGYHGGILHFIKNFGFNSTIDEDFFILFDIADVLAKTGNVMVTMGINEHLGLGLRNFISDIDKYEIAKKRLYSIGVSIAKREGSSAVVRMCENYGFDPIENRDEILGILLVALSNNFDRVIEQLEHTGIDSTIDIKGKSELVDIASFFRKTYGLPFFYPEIYMLRRDPGLWLGAELINNPSLTTHDILGDILGIERGSLDPGVRKRIIKTLEKEQPGSVFLSDRVAGASGEGYSPVACGDFYETVKMFCDVLDEELDIFSTRNLFFESEIFSKNNLHIFTIFIQELVSILALAEDKDKKKVLDSVLSSLKANLSLYSEEVLGYEGKPNFILNPNFFVDGDRDLKVRFTLEDLVKAVSLLHKSVNFWFAKAFNIKDDSDVEKLDALKKRWGSLDTFQVLFARYKSRKDWEDCVLVMERIFSFVVNDNSENEAFRQYKYYGYQAEENDEDRRKAQAQIGFLTESQRQMWTSNPWTLQASRDMDATNRDQTSLLEDNLRNSRDQLLANL